ncbi:MAG: pyrroloquinoline quinone-dependent dehydrogenase [Pseudomonadota bacterium]
MSRSPLRILVLIALALIAISFLGGTAMWRVWGFGDDLRIEGHAKIVRDAPSISGEGWTRYGGDAGGNRYSSAGQIDRGNVDKLNVAWTYRTGALEARADVRHRTSFQTTPIFVDESLIFCTQFNEVIALDPGAGEEIWRYDPQVPTDGRPANEFSCRGVSYWKDATALETDVCSSRVFMGTVEAHLIALDARTGEPCQDFGSSGVVQIEPSLALRWPGEFQITSAPAIVGDVVITGTAIGDNLRTDAPLGVVHAFDVLSGEAIWTFNPIPRDPDDPARASWPDGSADRVGHANVWSTISVDESRGWVFLPTSTASPDFYGGDRPGNNPHANSVVALDGATGDVIWSYQMVHHDIWDYDLPAQPGLYQIWRDGEAHDVVVQVTKMGLVFVLDRESGEPFHPVEERPVPQQGVTGELLSPTQPIPTIPEPIVPSRLNPDRAFGLTLWDKMDCERQLRALRADGLYTPPTLEGTLNYPFSGGGANWGSAAFDSRRNLLIINMNNAAQALYLYPDVEEHAEASEIRDGAEFAPMEGAPYAMSRELIVSPFGLPCTPPPWGVIAGIDLDSGEIVWRHPFGTTRDLAPGGLALNLGTPSFGGPIVTEGDIVFIGAAMDNYLRALDVETGRGLWKGRLPAGGQATPMTYNWQGRQYVVIAAGGHSKSGTKLGDHVVAFALTE